MSAIIVRPSSLTGRLVEHVAPAATQASSLPRPTEDDFRLLEEYGSILALERAGLHGVADRLLNYETGRDVD
ncbi:hypothetical protein [Rhodanobacter sp. FW106-PBR-LB-2-11]|uniref:hypothetical protein n=1 Tax=Rhodanobacter sp. FW106-PBR-LB-2-11 TaxID=1524463 RepID=UPI0034E4DE63